MALSVKIYEFITDHMNLSHKIVIFRFLYKQATSARTTGVSFKSEVSVFLQVLHVFLKISGLIISTRSLKGHMKVKTKFPFLF